MKADKFETEEEAQSILGSAQQPLGFCPMINDFCFGESCICYNKGWVRQGTKAWRVQHPFCQNVLISGCITVEQ